MRILISHEHLKTLAIFKFFQILYVEFLELLAEPLDSAEHNLDNNDLIVQIGNGN